ncbi:MAG: carboxylesterase family protein [Myxococcota bacterium]
MSISKTARLLALTLVLACESGGAVGDAAPDAAPDASAEGDFRVRIEAGELEGFETPEGALAFLGVPYAASPVGDLRFRAPEPVAAWSDVRVVDTFAPPCFQPEGATEVRGSEDCLYLNVWAPKARERLPVLVFIHGGGNVTGSASEETSPGFAIYDGARIAARDSAVVVTMQYRLNAFGYLADPSLDDEQPSGNYGPRDQVAALEWVARNIVSFGGDPNRVLLFGESGGASDVCALLATPSAAGLFHAAAIMSGGCGGMERTNMLQMGEDAAEALGCEEGDRAACLRTADAAALLAAVRRPSAVNGAASPWAAPTVDGAFLPERPIDAIQAGRHHRVPLMFGTTADETASPIFGVRFMLTDAEYEMRVRELFPRIAEAVLVHYPRSDFRTPRDALVAVTTDSQFTCTTREFARLASAWGPVFHYVYDHAYEGLADGALQPSIFGAAHGFELPILFQTIETYVDYESTGAELALGREMSGLWRRFAAEGVPADDWPTYDSDQSYILSTASSVARDFRGDECRFWLGRE